MAQRTLFTIGHSTRAWPAFVALLKVWKIKALVDVRALPRSRAFPWFGKRQMSKALPKVGIKYVHLPALGGLRTPRISESKSSNDGWRNDRFRAYADYMQTSEFAQGLRELNRRRKERRVCIMCAEAQWWRCHRRMISDAQTARGIPVRHIMSTTSARLHELTAFAVVNAKKTHSSGPIITYPSIEFVARTQSRSRKSRNLAMPREFTVGDHVSWNSEAGRVRGTIRKKITSRIRFKGYMVHASKDQPQYLIKSDTTDHLAMHRGSALRKLKSAAPKQKKSSRK